MRAAVIAESHEYFQAKRPFTFAGMKIEAGDILDLAEFDLPPGRGKMLENARRGVFVTLTDTSGVRHRDMQAPPQIQTEDRPADADDDGLPMGEWSDLTCRALTIAERRALLKSHGLVQRGSKDEQVDRLLAHRSKLHGI